MATLSSGQTSEDYKFTNKRSTRLTYILQWNGDATFELTIREPHGFVVLKTTAPDSPFRVDLQADILGDWVCQVKGVNLPYSNFPYVLTLVLDRHR